VDNTVPTGGNVGYTVMIYGFNFGDAQGSSEVYFNGVPCTYFYSWSNTIIICSVPSSATTGPVTVRRNGQISNNDVIFTVTLP
jgi:hypothetical protein